MNRTLTAATLSLLVAFAACTAPKKIQPPPVLEVQVLDSTFNAIIDTIQPTHRFLLRNVYSGLVQNVRDVVASGHVLAFITNDSIPNYAQIEFASSVHRSLRGGLMRKSPYDPRLTPDFSNSRLLFLTDSLEAAFLDQRSNRVITDDIGGGRRLLATKADSSNQWPICWISRTPQDWRTVLLSDIEGANGARVLAVHQNNCLALTINQELIFIDSTTLSTNKSGHYVMPANGIKTALPIAATTSPSGFAVLVEDSLSNIVRFGTDNKQWLAAWRVPPNIKHIALADSFLITLAQYKDSVVVASFVLPKKLIWTRRDSVVAPNIRSEMGTKQ